DDDQDVLAAVLAHLFPQLRHQRQVPGHQRADTDEVDAVLHRLPGRLCGRLKQRADVHVEAQICEGGGNYLLSAIVTVLSHLGDEDTRPTALGLLKLLHQATHFLHRALPIASRGGVYSAHHTNWSFIAAVDSFECFADLTYR